MLRKRITLIKLAMIFFVLNATAQEKQKMSIDELLHFATKNNYDLREARFNKTQSEFKIKETKANGLPKVDAEIDYKDYLKKASIILPGSLTGVEGAPDIVTQMGRKHNLDASIQYSQLLFSLKYINSVKITEKVLEIRKLEIEKTEEELIQLLYSEYYNLLGVYKSLEIIESNMESLELNRKKVAAMAEEGLALQTDLDKIDISYFNLQANKEKVLSGINVQTNNLKFIIGMDSDTELVVDTTGFSQLFDDQLLMEKYAIHEFDADNLVEVAILNKNIELNNSQVKLAKAETTPTVALYGSYMYQAMRDEFNIFDTSEDWFNVNVIGVKATIPIFAGFGNKAKISHAKIDQAITRDKMDKAQQGLNLQYQNSLMTYQTSIKNCRTQQRNVELAKKVKNQEELKYGEGIVTLTDYLLAEREHRNAQLNYAQNLLDMKKAEIDLLKAKGMLKAFVKK